MRAAVVDAVGSGFKTQEIDISEPGEGEVLVAVKASGLCHTDLTLSRFDLGFPMPTVFGHELSGTVSAVGPRVSGVTVGDHVVGCLIQHCGACSKCIADKTTQCLDPASTMRNSRLTRDGEVIHQAFGLGGFAEQALVHQNQLAVVPPEMPFAQAALLGCGVLTGAGSVLNTADVRIGDSVAVIGVGGVGLNAVSGARLAGATRIIAIDIHDAKLSRALLFGATDVVNASSTDMVRDVMALTDGGVDHVFEFVGNQSVTEQGLAMLGVGGGLYLAGLEKGGTSINVDTVTTVGQEKKIQGAKMGSSNLKRDIPMFADLYLQGRMNLDDLVSREISLDEIDAGYESLTDGDTVRVVVTSF